MFVTKKKVKEMGNVRKACENQKEIFSDLSLKGKLKQKKH